MKFVNGLIAFLITFTTYAQDKAGTVMVLPMKAALPAHAKKLGSIKVGDNSFKINCDYENVVGVAKKKAVAMGGNIVKITELVAPSFISKCYKIKADVYYSNELPEYPKENTGGIASNVDDYAVLYIYRLHDTIAPTPYYKLHLDNDSVICTVKGRFEDSIRLYKEGQITLWAKTENRVELKLDVQMGSAYYVRCGVQQTQFWLSPVIELVDKKTGAREFGELRKGKKGKKDMDVNYLGQVH